MKSDLVQNGSGLEKEPHLKRVLTLKYVVFFGLAYLAPTVVFNYYGIITESSRGMMALAYAITTIVMFFTAYSYAQMVKAFPVAGSAYTYVRKAINPHLGFMTGWVMLLDYLLVPMICYLIVGIYINDFFPAIPVWTVVVVCAAIIAVINTIGVEVAGRINMVVIIAQVGFTLLFIAVIIKFVMGGGGTGSLIDAHAVFNAPEFSLSGISAASAILAVCFLGFDAVTTMAEETKNPEKTIGKAVIIVCVGAGIAFAVISYFTQIAWPAAFSEFESSDAGIFELLDRLQISFMSTLFFVIDNFASLICAMAGLAAVSRILYGMGRDGMLPKRFFGYLHPKYKTPVFNIILTSLIALTAIFYADNLMGAASLISFGALTGFIMVNLSVIFYYYIKLNKRRGADIFRYLAMPLIGVAVCGYLWLSMESAAKLLGCGWLLIGFVYTAATTKFFSVMPPEMELD